MGAAEVIAVVVTAVAFVASLAHVLSYRIGVLERKARIQREQTDAARAREAEARALEAAGTLRLSALRADTVLRAIRASSRIAGAAGMFTVKARQPAAVLLGRTPDLGPLQDAVTEVSLALDEIRLVGPRFRR